MAVHFQTQGEKKKHVLFLIFSDFKKEKEKEKEDLELTFLGYRRKTYSIF